MTSVKRIDFTFKAAIAAYFLSLALPVFYTEEVTLIEWDRDAKPGTTWYGIFVLLLGWTAALGSPTRHEYWSIAWFANPLFFIAVAQIRKRRAYSLHFSIIGLVVALTSLFLKKIWNDKEPPSVFITEYGAGFYLWLIAFVLIVIVAWKNMNLRQ